jgi:hypothetical protein
MATGSRLLVALPRKVYEKLAPNLKRVSLQQGKILHHPGETIKNLYFPIDCLLSMTITMSNGSTAEAGMSCPDPRAAGAGRACVQVFQDSQRGIRSLTRRKRER